ncbi:thiamine-monophosphate kinase [Methanobrevibacter gottschalkii]|uniref:Thiamine-monophosphate kinase n=3 Tax=Methanobacteriaceae TaxID=2159 RepID=A0A3N5C0G6_9EURY|nr:thiamine-monophosphate kinase [Methanobrevibacter gottschalkii DSM 11977]SEK18562.1 thiamine-monophosphate kinase [Methanobrevibacter gottschalkii]
MLFILLDYMILFLRQLKFIQRQNLFILKVILIFMSLKVSDIGEKELVRYIIANSKKITPDDAAITPFYNSNLISTCDMLIQSRHFPKNMSYYDMGFKSVTVNVSDLAAMGAKPLGFLLSMAIPKNLEVDNFKEIVGGVLKACDYYSIPLIGGDTNEASEIIISGTALGLCDNPLMKNNYKKDDLIAITGDIGLAALGFEIDDLDSIYVKHALRPKARINEGQILKKYGATSATDITDGLASELYEIKKDGFGFMIHEELLGITDEYKNLASNLNLDYLDLVFHIGEDFELLFTISKENLEKLPIEYKVIGIVSDSDVIELTLENGFVEQIKNKGYEHYVGE